MRLTTLHSQRGSILLAAAVFAFILYAAGVSLAGSVYDRVEVERDGTDSLKAELAAESGIQYAQRRLLLNSTWTGTGQEGITLPDGSHFVVTAELEENSAYGADVHVVAVEGSFGQGLARLGGGIRVYGGDGGTSSLALIFLGQNFTMSHGMVYGDALLVDRAFKCDDWMFDAQNQGYYAESHGPSSDGVKQFICTGVDGTVFKYRDDLDDYQWLGEEVVISSNSTMPSWNLAEFATPRAGQVNLTNPHNLGNTIWKLNGLTYEETVVITLLNNQTVTLTNCHFNGGLVVISPFAQNARLGNSNLVHIKKGTTIGGGDGGVYPHIGLIAPGGKLKSDNDASTITGFSLLKEVDLFKYGTFEGQLVILEYCKNLKDCEVSYLPEVGENLPPCFSFGNPGGYTDVIGMFENYD
jgi:hypothetical protein